MRQRVARLVESGALRITAVTDAALVGRPRAAMLGIRAEGDLGELAGRLAEVDGVVQVVITAGSVDLLAEVACTDDEHLLRVINIGVRPQPGVTSVEAFIHLSPPYVASRGAPARSGPAGGRSQPGAAARGPATGTTQDPAAPTQPRSHG